MLQHTPRRSVFYCYSFQPSAACSFVFLSSLPSNGLIFTINPFEILLAVWRYASLAVMSTIAAIQPRGLFRGPRVESASFSRSHSGFKPKREPMFRICLLLNHSSPSACRSQQRASRFAYEFMHPEPVCLSQCWI